MIFEIRKAIEALLHPGIKSNIFTLVRNAIPYYLSPRIDAFAPLTIYVSINSICNMRCKMCDVGQKNIEGAYYKRLCIDESRPQLSIEVFKRMIQETAAFKPHIAICATEPLLYKDLPEAIACCEMYQVPVTVTTAGYHLAKQARELIDAGLKSLVVSLDGPAQIHNLIRGREDAFERAIDGVKFFKSEALQRGRVVHISTSCVINNYNYQHLAEFASLCQELPFNNINFVHLWFISKAMAVAHNAAFAAIFPVTESCTSDDIRLKDIDPIELYDQIQRVKKIPNTRILGDFSLEQLRKFYQDDDLLMRRSSQCMAPWFFTQVLANGNVVPYSRCFTGSLGNIYEEPLLNIWNGAKYKEWRCFIKKHKKMPACGRCDLIL